MPETGVKKKGNHNVLIGILIASAITGGAVWRHKTGPYHFKVVQPGMLYRSGWMKPAHEQQIIEKYGIKTVVNLCLPNEELEENNHTVEAAICKRTGAALVNIPMPGNTPPTEEQLAEWLHLLHGREHHPILVHCAQGVARTGIMIAVYRMDCLKEDNVSVFEKLDTFKHDFDVPKRKAVKEFILNYKPARDVPVAADIRP